MSVFRSGAGGCRPAPNNDTPVGRSGGESPSAWSSSAAWRPARLDLLLGDRRLHAVELAVVGDHRGRQLVLVVVVRLIEVGAKPRATSATEAARAENWIDAFLLPLAAVVQDVIQAIGHQVSQDTAG